MPATGAAVVVVAPPTPQQSGTRSTAQIAAAALPLRAAFKSMLGARLVFLHKRPAAVMDLLPARYPLRVSAEGAVEGLTEQIEDDDVRGTQIHEPALELALITLE